LAAGQGITSLVATFLPDAKHLIEYDPFENNAAAAGGTMGAASMWLPPQAIVVAFVFSAGVGLIFGMFPAIKAARLDPIEALRHE
jgi:putative ABC transport system permease protein